MRDRKIQMKNDKWRKTCREQKIEKDRKKDRLRKRDDSERM